MKAKTVNRMAAELNGNGQKKLKPIKRSLVTLRIVSISPLVTHRWSEKAKGMMRDKHAGKKTKDREIRNPEAEGREAAYFTEGGKHGIPAMAIKASMINAAHKDLGIEKTLVKKALFLVCDDVNGVLAFDTHSEPVIQEDVVRVGQGSTDLRYRPYYYKWSVVVSFDVDMELLTIDDLVTLMNRAGFGVGLMEMRPEKGGEFGRFEVDVDHGVKVEGL